MIFFKTIFWFLVFKVCEFFQFIWFLIKKIPDLLWLICGSVLSITILILAICIVGLPLTSLLIYCDIHTNYQPDSLFYPLIGRWAETLFNGGVTIAIILLCFGFYRFLSECGFWSFRYLEVIVNFFIDNWEKASERAKR